MFFPAAGIGNNRGMALLITIMVISLLFAVTVQFNRTVRHMFFASAIQLEGQNLRTIAQSGLTIAAAMLEVDGAANGYDTLQEPWSVPDEAALGSLFGRGTLKLEITDLSGKLQVNSLVPGNGGGPQGDNPQNANENKEILKRLLLSGNFELESEQQAEEIVDAIVDWIDTNDLESDFGAEDGYYQSLNPPYTPQNGPITDVEELLLVKGVTPRILFGVGGQPGLADYVTAYGTDGKININTAPVGVLRALHPLMTAEQATALDEYRRDKENFQLLENSGWYQSVGILPGDIELPEQLISTRSSVFQVRSEGRYLDQTRRLTSVVERADNNQILFLSRKVE